mgnify:CR=1 FL=1
MSSTRFLLLAASAFVAGAFRAARIAWRLARRMSRLSISCALTSVSSS